MTRAPTTAGALTAKITVPAASDNALSEAEARALIDGIKADYASAEDHLARACDGLAEAYRRRAWVALGYRTWAEFCNAEFSDRPFRLLAGARRAVVESLREAGMSQRAIASAVGASQKTIDRDLGARESGESNDSRDEPSPAITGLDGKQYPAQSKAVRLVEQVLGGELLPDAEVVEGEIVDDAGPVPLPPAPPVSLAPKTDPPPISPKRPRQRAATTRKPRARKPAGEIPLWEAVDGLHAALREQLLRRGVTAVTHRRADDLARTEITFIVTVATNGRADDPARWTVTVRGPAKAAESVRDGLREYADEIQTIARLLDDAITKAR